MTLRRRAPVRRRDVDDEGLTLIECLVGMVVFALMSGAVLATLNQAFVLTRSNTHRAVAANVAAQEIDSLRMTDLDTVNQNDLGPRSYDVNVGGDSYHVVRTAQWQPQGSDGGSCDGSGGASPTGALAYLKVGVVVSWPRMSGVKPVTSSTIISPKAASYDLTKGAISLKVLDASGKPLPGISISLAGGPTSAPAQVTTDDGCVLFPALAAGSYTASAGVLDSPPWVGTDGSTTPNATGTVKSRTTTTLSLQMDQSARLTPEAADPSYPRPATLPVTLSAGSTIQVVDASALTNTLLFPYTSGWQVWAGSCNDADPAGTRTGYSPSQRVTTATPPGSSNTVPLAMGKVDVSVVTTTGKAVSGAAVQAVHASETNSLCNSGLTLDLGKTDASGKVHVSLPFGSWSLKLASTSGTTKTPGSVVLDPTVSTAKAVSVVKQ